MKIKRFFAKDIRSALDEIKVALGPDAIIMSNKKVDGGVEIVAAIDDDNIATIPKSSQSAGVKAMPASPASAKANSGMARNKNLNTSTAKSSASRANASVNKTAVPRTSATDQTRDVSEDQVSLSGFQQRLVKQQLQAQADQFIVNESAKNQPTKFERLAQAVERRQADTPSPFPAWAQTESMASTSQSSGFSAQQHHSLDSNQPDFSRVNNNQTANSNNNQALDELRQEMASMRQLLQHQVNGLVGQDVARRDPIRSMLSEQLVEAGFDSEIAQQVVINIPPGSDLEHAKLVIADSISRRLITTNNDVIEQGGIVALLGPTGVGKTTTVAKLAARYAMMYGSDQVALITTDSYRIGAYEQLNTYGKILGCPVKVAKDAQQLADALYQLRNKRLVLIDTAGMGQRDVRLSEQLATLVNTSHVNIRSYLVLPATAQRKVLQEAIEQFRKIPIAGCIMTKMDEALGVGEIISVAIGHSLPIGYVTNGQRVPEDIGVVDINVLVNGVIEQLGDGVHNNNVSSVPAQFVSFNR